MVRESAKVPGLKVVEPLTHADSTAKAVKPPAHADSTAKAISRSVRPLSTAKAVEPPFHAGLFEYDNLR